MVQIWYRNCTFRYSFYLFWLKKCTSDYINCMLYYQNLFSNPASVHYTPNSVRSGTQTVPCASKNLCSVTLSFVRMPLQYISIHLLCKPDYLVYISYTTQEVLHTHCRFPVPTARCSLASVYFSHTENCSRQTMVHGSLLTGFLGSNTIHFQQNKSYFLERKLKENMTRRRILILKAEWDIFSQGEAKEKYVATNCSVFSRPRKLTFSLGGADVKYFATRNSELKLNARNIFSSLSRRKICQDQIFWFSRLIKAIFFRGGADVKHNPTSILSLNAEGYILSQLGVTESLWKRYLLVFCCQSSLVLSKLSSEKS